MRKFWFTLSWSFCLLFWFCSCNKVEDTFLRFDIDQTYEMTIPIIPFDSIQAPVPTPDITNTFDQAFEANSTRADKVRDIKLSKLKFTIVTPVEKDFSFMKDVELFLAAQGVETTLIAFKFDIPVEVGNVLELETTGENLDKFKNIGSYNFVVNVVTRAPVDEPIDVKADMIFKVTADVF